MMEKIKSWWHHMMRYVSPTFVILICASFIMWYILKLQYTYTTDLVVLVNIEGEQMRVPCVIEGKGTNLFGYRVYMHKEIKIPLSDLKYTTISDMNDATGEIVDSIIIDPQSIQSAISVRFSDIKVIAVGDIPMLKMPDL